MEEHISTILDRALTRLETGEPIEKIIADYPAHQDDLLLLLRMAQKLSRQRAVPVPALPDQGLADFLHQAQDLRQASRTKKAPGQSRWRRLAYHLDQVMWLSGRRAVRMVLSAICIVILILSSLGTTVALAQDSLPGDMIYPAKLAGEEIHLSLIIQYSVKAKYHLYRAQTRLDEICRLAMARRQIYAETLQRMNRSLQASLISAAQAGAGETEWLLALIEQTTAEQIARLNTLETMTTWSHARVMLEQTRQSVTVAQTWAREGQKDLTTFRINASLNSLNDDPLLWPTRAGQPIVWAIPTASPTGTYAPIIEPTRLADDPTPIIHPTFMATNEPIVEPPDAATPTATASVIAQPDLSPTTQPTLADPTAETARVTRTPTSTKVPTPTRTPTSTKVPTPTRTPTSTKVPTPTRTPTSTKVPTPTRTPTPTREPKPTREMEPTVTPEPTQPPVPKPTKKPKE